MKLPGALATTMIEQICGDQLIPAAHNSWDRHVVFCSSEVTQACGDQVASAHRQWSKLLETEPEPGCVPGGSHNGALQKATATHRLSLPAAQGLCVT